MCLWSHFYFTFRNTIKQINIGEGLELELPKRLYTEDIHNFRVFKWDARKIVREGRVFHPAENDYLVSSIYDISNQAFRFPDGEVDKVWVKIKLDEGKAEENRVYKAVVIADKQPTYKKAWLKVCILCYWELPLTTPQRFRYSTLTSNVVQQWVWDYKT